MKHYRVNKLDAPGGAVVKRRDILANNDHEAVALAADHEDCPICEVLRAGKQVGTID